MGNVGLPLFVVKDKYVYINLRKGGYINSKL